MCGICGIIGTDGRDARTQDMLVRMLHTMKHRGPDGEGFYFDELAALGHTRLSIIDVEFGRQPMSNEDGNLTIIFNGEIYNYIELRAELAEKGHTFRTKSDTETILHAYEEYGDAFVHRLNGMFAFAIWDRNKQRLLLSRDRLGVKPLYFAHREGQFVFASEIKALLENPVVRREADPASIAEYMVRSYVTGEKTFLSDVRKLRPGHFLALSGGSIKTWKYWDITFGEGEDLGQREYVERLSWLVSDSVRLRLRSDVPVGAYLSGGIDSSTVVCTACKEHGYPLKTFSGAFAEGPEYDERKYIKLVTDECHTEHYDVVPAMEEFFEKLPRLIWYLDEPVVGAGVFPQYVVSRLAGAHVKVVLGGEGGDELFAGYTKYYRPYFVSRLADCGRLRPGQASAATLISDVVRFLIYRGSTDIPLFIRRLSSPPSTSVLSPRLQRLASELRSPATPANLNRFNTLLYTDLKEYLQGLLHVDDRTGMAASVESRAPLLDYRIVELAASVPYEYKMRKGLTKYLLREAARGRVPDQILSRKDKMGFPTPINIWFSRRGPVLRKFFDSEDTERVGFIDRVSALEVVSEHLRGARDNSVLIWKMLNVMLWFRLFIEKAHFEDVDVFRTLNGGHDG